MRRTRGSVAPPVKEGPLNLTGTTRTAIKVIAIHGANGKGTDVLRYRGVQYLSGAEFAVDPLDLPDLVAKKLVQPVDDLPTPRWWDAEGRVLQCEPGNASVLFSAPQAGSLKIFQGTGYDPGNAVYRFHSAVNEYSRHCSAFVKTVTSNNDPFHCPTQYNATKHPAMARALALDADVIHCHIDWAPIRNIGLGPVPRRGQLLIKHYHGTQFTPDGLKPLPDREQVPMVYAAADDLVAGVIVGARLTLCALRPGRIQWLPITVPVARYAAMATGRAPWEPSANRPFRIAHSPTMAKLKGTAVFQKAIRKLKAEGLPVEAVMITGKTHAAALQLKATADACFDSFALGIQGSGLEAAAMGQPVIAGDRDVQKLYQAELGYCPYTFADSRGLMDVIARMATDFDYYATEQRRVGQYVREIHDYPAVARRYEGILSAAMKNRRAA